MNFQLAIALVLVQMCLSGRITREVGDKCTTPNQEAGECRNIKNCPVLLDYVRESVAPTSSFLRESNCGFDGLDSLVCCPELSSRQTPWEEPWGRPRPISSTQRSTRTPNRNPTTSRSTSTQSNECGKALLEVDRIVGGTDASLGTWPWIAALGYTSRTKSGVQWLCGGALVTNKHVVTAAHCVVIPRDKTLSVVRLGELNLEEGVNDGASPVDLQVERSTAHPQYKSTEKVNDIAIVKLKGSVRFTDHIQPICLPDSSQMRSNSFVGQTPYVAGWGAVSFRGPVSKFLQQVDLQITDEETCRNSYINQRGAVIDNRVVCAYKPKKDACQGDSGGPLMLDQGATYYLVGIVSYGKNCAEPGYPGVYTRVTAFVDWIKDNLD